MAHTHMRVRDFVILSIPFNHRPNKLVILDGGEVLKVKCTTLQTDLAKEHEINKCSTDSCRAQKTHVEQPVHLRLTRLSLVKKNFL